MPLGGLDSSFSSIPVVVITFSPNKARRCARCSSRPCLSYRIPPLSDVVVDAL